MASAPGLRVASPGELPPGTARKFTLTCSPATPEGFLIDSRGIHYACGCPA